MQRRKYLAALGSLAAGGATIAGTGAFTSVEANRSVDVEVAGDSSAYLALQKAADDSSDPGANSDAYVSISSGEVSFDFGASNGTTDLGDGFNPDSVTVIEDLIEVQNQGTQSAYLSVDLSNLDVTGTSGNNAGVGLAVSVPDDAGTNPDDTLNDNVAFQSGDPDAYANGVVDDPAIDGAYELGQGESVHLDLTVDTTPISGTDISTDGAVTFIADQDSSL